MAVLAVAAGGAIAGGVLGGLVPGVGVLLGVQLGFLGGAILGNILFPTENIDVGGPTRDDIRISSAGTGRFVPIVFGVFRIAGQYLWVTDPVFTDKTESVGGGKGGGGGADVTTTTVKLSWISGICEGPIAAVTRIWLDDDLVWDISENNTEGPAFSDALIWETLITKQINLPPSPDSISFTDTTQVIQVQQLGPIRIYLGGEDPPLEPMLQNDTRIGEAFGGDTSDFVVPFHGLAYAAFEGIPGEAINGHFPQVEFEVLTGAAPAGTGIEYDPVPCRSRENLLGDLTTYVCLTPNDLTGTVYTWNVIDKNILEPSGVTFELTGNVPATANSLKAQNIGTWDDPGLLRVFISGGGDLRFSQHSLKTGAEIAPQTIWPEHPGSTQPIGGWYYPNTKDPTYFIGVAETSDDIFSLDLSRNMVMASRGLGASLVDVPGTDITNLSFTFTPGFVGPDGLLYTAMGTGNTKFAIIAWDPITLEIRRAFQPYRSSPASDDAFYERFYITYDKVTDKIICYTPGIMRRVDRETLTLDSVPDLLTGGAGSLEDNYELLKHGPYFGQLWIQTAPTNEYALMDIWKWIGPICVHIGTDDSGVRLNNENASYDPINGGLWVQDAFDTGYTAFMPVCRLSPLCVTAESIAQDISDRCEVPSTLRDTSAWSSDIICGYAIGRQISGRKALESIAGAINGDFRTQDGKVNFFKLDSASVATIPEEDLGAAEQIDAKVPGRDIRWPYERELPKRVDVQFVDRKMDHSSNTTGFDRPTEGFKGRANETVHMPIVFDTPSVPQPNEIAERLLFSFDAHRRSHRIQLTWEHLKLNVGDSFKYVHGNDTHTVRIEKLAIAENNLMAIEARSEDVSVNTASGQSGITQSVLFDPTDTDMLAPITTQLFMIDSSLMRDVDDDGTGIPIYAAVASTGATEDFAGARLLKSDDGRTTWSIAGVFTKAISWGIATTALATAARPHTIDRDNSVTVNMVKGILPGSVTNPDLNENRNLHAFLIGADGRWEVIRPATIINDSGSPDDDGDTYTLSEMRRGQRGTSHNVGTHVANDTLLVLDPTKMLRVVLDINELNVERLYKAVTVGQPEALASSVSFTLAGESKKPYSLAHVQGSRNISTGVWTVTAVRRTRLGGGWVDFTEPPLAEASEEYEVDVLTGPGGTVIASLTKTGLTSPSTSWTEAELVTAGLASGGSPGASPFSLTVKWYQISAIVGRGNTEEVTLSSPTPGS